MSSGGPSCVVIVQKVKHTHRARPRNGLLLQPKRTRPRRCQTHTRLHTRNTKSRRPHLAPIINFCCSHTRRSASKPSTWERMRTHTRAEVADRWVNPSPVRCDAMARMTARCHLFTMICVCVCTPGLMAVGWFALKSQWPVTFRSCLESRAQACGISLASADPRCQE